MAGRRPPETPTVHNLPPFLQEVRNQAVVRERGSDWVQLARFSGIVCGLMLLSWVAWDSTPPLEWLRAVGPPALEEVSSISISAADRPAG